MSGKKTIIVRNTCPICHQGFDDPSGGLAPTCGNPNCIREARSRGLPFRVPTPSSAQTPAGQGKARRGKSTTYK